MRYGFKHIFSPACLGVGGDQVQILCHEKRGMGHTGKGRMVNVHVPLCHPWFRGFQPPWACRFLLISFLKGQYRHDQSKLSTGIFGIGVPV